jgi:hypothetical protein
MYPHRIRLRGPWEYKLLDRTGDNPPSSGRLVLPCAPGEAGVAGRCRFRRRFGYPGRIDAHERVWLIVEGTSGKWVATLNGATLGDMEGSSEFDVTEKLQPRNTLELAGMLKAGAAPWDEVALEVRCRAYLRGVRLERRDGRIHAVGEVVGSADGPLELYLIADRSPAAYAQVKGSGGVEPFDLWANAVDGEGREFERMKIDLVQGASVWYTVEMAVSAGAQRSGA